MTPNFSLSELTASSTAKARNIDNTPPPAAVEALRDLATSILQPLRNRYGKPITVTSGYRSPALNKAVGGVATSQHLKGEAADIVCDNNRALWNLAVSMVKSGEITVGQLLNEKGLSWIHISLPSAKHRNFIL